MKNDVRTDERRIAEDVHHPVSGPARRHARDGRHSSRHDGNLGQLGRTTAEMNRSLSSTRGPDGPRYPKPWRTPTRSGIRGAVERRSRRCSGYSVMPARVGPALSAIRPLRGHRPTGGCPAGRRRRTHLLFHSRLVISHRTFLPAAVYHRLPEPAPFLGTGEPAIVGSQVPPLFGTPNGGEFTQDPPTRPGINCYRSGFTP